MFKRQDFHRFFRHNSRGFALVEVVIAIALLGMLGVAFLGGLSTASKAIFIADERATAESLARSQMEYIKSQSYNATYEKIDDIPGYGIEFLTEEAPVGLQKITITVKHNDIPIIISGNYTLQGYKVNR